MALSLLFPQRGPLFIIPTTWSTFFFSPQPGPLSIVGITWPSLFVHAIRPSLDCLRNLAFSLLFTRFTQPGPPSFVYTIWLTLSFVHAAWPSLFCSHNVALSLLFPKRGPLFIIPTTWSSFFFSPQPGPLSIVRITWPSLFCSRNQALS